MSADASDLSLVRRVQRGDKGAFDALVLKYQHKLVKLVMRYVRNPAEAEDIAEEAFIKAYRALPQFRGHGLPRGDRALAHLQSARGQRPPPGGGVRGRPGTRGGARMNEELDSQLSAMFDDELAPEECELLARRLSRDEQLKARWGRYAV